MVQKAPKRNDVNNSVIVTRLSDGGILLEPVEQLGDYHRCVGEMYIESVQRRPDKPFLCERDINGEWRRVTYKGSLKIVRSLAQALLMRGCSAEHPLMILSGNSIEHALFTLAALYIGVPVVPVSPAYSLMSSDYGKLRHVVEVTRPSLIFVQSLDMFQSALESLELEDVDVIAVEQNSDVMESTSWGTLTEITPTEDIDAAFREITPDTVAKYLFSSGSTAMPKAVINNHRMLCSNQQAIMQIYPLFKQESPVLVDWLPWNHTFGGNHNFNMVLSTAGTLYIDNGKPLPGKFQESIKNLIEISPTAYFNVPAGFQMLVQHMELNDELRENFYKKLKLIYYAAAALPQPVFDKLNALSYKTLGHYVPITTGYGSTETAPLATAPATELTNSSGIGIPVPGAKLKLAPVGDKLEIRVKGPLVTPGYLRDPEKTRVAFDDEGYYKMGDAVKFLDPDKQAEGLYFDGRISEDFKLLSGSWVSVGNVRVAVINAAAPLIRDLVVTGHDRNYIGALIWLNLDACRREFELSNVSDKELISKPQIVASLSTRIRLYNAENSGSSVKVSRAIIMLEPPLIDKNEITDKGYINQSAVLNNRQDLVELLYLDKPSNQVLEF